VMVNGLVARLLSNDNRSSEDDSLLVARLLVKGLRFIARGISDDNGSSDDDSLLGARLLVARLLVTGLLMLARGLSAGSSVMVNGLVARLLSNDNRSSDDDSLLVARLLVTGLRVLARGLSDDNGSSNDDSLLVARLLVTGLRVLAGGLSDDNRSSDHDSLLIARLLVARLRVLARRTSARSGVMMDGLVARLVARLLDMDGSSNDGLVARFSDNNGSSDDGLATRRSVARLRVLARRVSTGSGMMVSGPVARLLDVNRSSVNVNFNLVLSNNDGSSVNNRSSNNRLVARGSVAWLGVLARRVSTGSGMMVNSLVARLLNMNTSSVDMNLVLSNDNGSSDAGVDVVGTSVNTGSVDKGTTNSASSDVDRSSVDNNTRTSDYDRSSDTSRSLMVMMMNMNFSILTRSNSLVGRLKGKVDIDSLTIDALDSVKMMGLSIVLGDENGTIVRLNNGLFVLSGKE
jgi:hypothetical protein